MPQLNQTLLDETIDFLSNLCRGLDMDPVHWVTGSDESLCWCGSCARYMVRHLRRRDKKNRAEYGVGGGYGSTEEGPASCHGCGKPLEYSLSESGVGEELDHFLEYGFVDDDDQISPHTAYELYEVLTSGRYLEDVWSVREITELLEQLRAYRARLEAIDCPPLSFGLG